MYISFKDFLHVIVGTLFITLAYLQRVNLDPTDHDI